jgi:hypothetical protein
MRWSQTFIPTLKESPSDAEIISHKLLLRAGLVRKLTGGLYTFLPMGLRVLRKIEQIIREELNRAGGIEVLMPALQPPERCVVLPASTARSASRAADTAVALAATRPWSSSTSESKV